jgi:hypothetical protein
MCSCSSRDVITKCFKAGGFNTGFRLEEVITCSKRTDEECGRFLLS